jgi:hypothetical protein
MSEEKVLWKLAPGDEISVVFRNNPFAPTPRGTVSLAAIMGWYKSDAPPASFLFENLEHDIYMLPLDAVYIAKLHEGAVAEQVKMMEEMERAFKQQMALRESGLVGGVPGLPNFGGR